MFAIETPNDMVECPYNKLHRMARKRLQPHLVKCRMSYPNAELCKCPFNVSHLVPEPEFSSHVESCPDKGLLTQYKYNAAPIKKEEEDRKQVEVDCDENWDDTEAEAYDPNKYATQASVIRKPYGQLPSARKEFRKNERKRLGDNSDEDEDEVTPVKVEKDDRGERSDCRPSSSKYRKQVKKDDYKDTLTNYKEYRAKVGKDQYSNKRRNKNS